MDTKMKVGIKNWVDKAVLLVCTLALFTSQLHAETTVTYFHTNAQGSVIGASNAQGDLLWQEAYKPFGERTLKQTTDEKMGFAGHADDKASGLVYMGARYYDPTVGRFLSIDPIGVSPANTFSVNRYAYANNNPYKFVDPDGQTPLAAILIFGIGVVAFSEYANTPALGQETVKKGLVDYVGALVPPVLRAEVEAGTLIKIGDDVATGLPIPTVSDSKLGNLVSDLYKGAKGPNPIGTGSTADAIRNELATGMQTHGTFHSQKGEQYINALKNWLRKNPEAPHHDRLVAESLKDDLQNALGRD